MIKTLALSVAAFFSAQALAQIDFTDWHTPVEMEAELANLAATHPTIAKSIAIGTSVEGRSIYGLKISDNVNTDETDEGDVVFVALHHAREWISAEMALYLAEYLVTTYAAGTDPALNACINNLEIWIVPVVNPDGYIYTTTPGNRFWRKNRRNNGDGTFGVDLNRNYGYQWGGGSGSEGSDISADSTYRGPYAFSEPETVAVRDFVLGLDNPKALLTYHSFSQLLLRPWSYTNFDPPGEYTLQYIVQDSIARIAAVHGVTYNETISYNAYGETTDHFWNEMRLAGFTPELRPGPGPITNFDPPPSTIIPNNEENLPAAIALIKDAGTRRVWIKDHVADTGVEPSAVWLGDHWSHAFWTSPDIWTVPETLVEGSTVTLNVRVHNDTSSIMAGCTVRAYYTDPRIVLEFPSLDSVLIGSQPIDLPPGDTTLTFPWVVPVGTNSWGERHWCVGAIAYHPDDRPLTTQVQRTSNLACRNFNTTESVLAGQTLLVAVANYLDVPAEFRVNVVPQDLPRGWNVVIPTVQSRLTGSLRRKARLLGIQDNVLAPGQVCMQPVRVNLPNDVKLGTVHDINVHAALIPLVPGKRVPLGNGYTFRMRVGDDRIAGPR